MPSLTIVDATRNASEYAALERLIQHAKGDTGQGRCCANFLLAWWNANSCDGFDLTNLWGLDSEIAADMVTVFAYIARVHSFPDTLGYESDFKAIVRAWRPDVAAAEPGYADSRR